jgi:hypothetical protein
MKKVLLFTFLLSACLTGIAQVPQKFSYQAVAVDASGSEMKNTPLCIRASIISGSFNGTEQWVEVHPNTKTDDYGLFTVEIGTGNPIGGSQSAFANIAWGNTPHFLKIEMSLNGQCSNFILVGTNQLLAVPYSFYSERAGKANTAVKTDTALVAVTALSNPNDNDGDPTNELQQLSISGKTLSLSGGNAITIDPQALGDNDGDPTNELQQLSVNGKTLSLSGSNSVTLDIQALGDNDSDPTNELQQLSVSGKTLSLSGGNSVTLDIQALGDNDSDPTNELQQLSITGKTLSLSGGNSITIDPQALGDNDGDPTNELQNLTFDSTSNKLGLSGSNTVIDLSNLSGFNASGSNFDYPQGITGVLFQFFPDMVTVPNDSVLYIVASEDEMFLPGVGGNFGRHFTGPNLPVLKPGTVVDECRCIGFFKPYNSFFEPILVVLKPNQGNFYQVPFGKNFVIKSGMNQTTPISLNGLTISPFGYIIKSLPIPDGVQIKNLSNDEIILSGYLVKK